MKLSKGKIIRNKKIKQALIILKSIDRRSIKYKNSWRHYLGHIEGFIND